MIQDNEVVMLLMAIGVLIFIIVNRRLIMRIQAARVLIAAFCVLLAAYVLTVLKGFFLEDLQPLGDLLNLLEHLCYAASSVLIALWCMKVFKPKESG